MAFIEREITLDLTIDHPYTKTTKKALLEECRKKYEGRYYSIGIIHQITSIINHTNIEIYLDYNINKGRATANCHVKFFVIHSGDIIPVKLIKYKDEAWMLVSYHQTHSDNNENFD